MSGVKVPDMRISPVHLWWISFFLKDIINAPENRSRQPAEFRAYFEYGEPLWSTYVNAPIPGQQPLKLETARNFVVLTKPVARPEGAKGGIQWHAC